MNDTVIGISILAGFSFMLAINALVLNLIGRGKIKNPMYDTEEKRESMRKMTNFLLPVFIACGCFFLFLAII